MPMPPLEFSAINPRVNGGRLIRTVAIPVPVLLAILAATIQYINTKPDAALAEFINARKWAVSVPQSMQLEDRSRLRCDLRKLLITS